MTWWTSRFLPSAARQKKSRWGDVSLRSSWFLSHQREMLLKATQADALFQTLRAHPAPGLPEEMDGCAGMMLLWHRRWELVGAKWEALGCWRWLIRWTASAWRKVAVAVEVSSHLPRHHRPMVMGDTCQGLAKVVFRVRKGHTHLQVSHGDFRSEGAWARGDVSDCVGRGVGTCWFGRTGSSCHHHGAES